MLRKLSSGSASVILILVTIMFQSPGWTGQNPPAKAGSPGQHSAQLGPIYEVNLEYFPHHQFTELTAMMPRLEKLGIKIIYILPIWECLGAQQYLIADYYKINPRYGTAADLKELVATAHQHGISVLLDFVTSLTYDGSYIFANHPDWILQDLKGERQRYFPFPQFGWALDCTNPQVIDYFTKVARYYVEEFDIDGWRVDSPANNYDAKKISGDHTRIQMLRSVKAAITKVKPAAILIAENTGPAWCISKLPIDTPPLFDEMCDAAYNYPLCGFMGGSAPGSYHYVVPGPWDNPQTFQQWTETMLDKVVYQRATSREFVEAVKHQPILNNRLRANFTENHDTARVAEGFPDQHRALFVLIATMPGLPVVHAGEEVGAKTHPQASTAASQVVNWQGGDKELEAFYTQVLKIRSENKALQEGDIDDVWKGGDNVIAYLRSCRGSQVITAVNFSPQPARSTLAVPVDKSGIKLESQYLLRDETDNETFIRKGRDLQNLELDLPAYGCRVISVKPHTKSAH